MKKYFVYILAVAVLSISYFVSDSENLKKPTASSVFSVAMPKNNQLGFANNTVYNSQNFPQSACGHLALIAYLQAQLKTASPNQKPALLRLIAKAKQEHRRCN